MTRTPTWSRRSWNRCLSQLVSEVRLIDLADERGAVGDQPARRARVLRPRPDRRLGRARRPRPVGAVGAADAVDPRTDRQDSARGQSAPLDRGARAVHDPRRAQAALAHGVPLRRAQEGARPIPARMVGARLRRLADRVPGRGAGPCPDPADLLRLLRAGAGHPRPAALDRSTSGGPSSRAASCWSPPRRARSGATWPRWSAPRCSTWSTPQSASRNGCPRTSAGAPWSWSTRCRPSPASSSSRCSPNWASTALRSCSPPRA